MHMAALNTMSLESSWGPGVSKHSLIKQWISEQWRQILIRYFDTQSVFYASKNKKKWTSYFGYK